MEQGEEKQSVEEKSPAKTQSKGHQPEISNPSSNPGPSPEPKRAPPPVPQKQPRPRPFSSVETGSRDSLGGNYENIMSSILQNNPEHQESPAKTAAPPPPVVPRSKQTPKPPLSQPADTTTPGSADSESTAGKQQQVKQKEENSASGLQGEKLEEYASMQSKQQQQQKHDGDSSMMNQSAEQSKRSPGPSPSPSPSPRLRRATPPQDKKPLRPSSSVDSSREFRAGSDVHISSLLWRRSMSLTPAEDSLRGERVWYLTAAIGDI